MKRIIILLLALMPIVASAQEMTVDHTIQDVVWSSVRKSQVTYNQALQYILAYNVLDDVVCLDNMIAGNIHPIYLDYETAGYGRMKVPLYLSNGMFTCRVVIYFKEGRYKAEAFDMVFKDVSGGMSGTTRLYSGYGEYGFDIAVRLVLDYLTKITTVNLPSDDW